MENDLDYSQQRSLNLGIAINTGSIGAAAIYDDLVYAQKVFGEGYFYRSYEQMMKRFPMWSERTLRNYVKKLEDKGWILTKVKKIDGRPVCHYKICRFLSAKFADSKDSVKIAETYNDKETKKETKPAPDISFGAKNKGAANATAVRSLLDHLIRIVNPNEKPTDERIRVLNGRMKDYTEAEILSAAHAFSKSEWHRENKQMSIDNLIAPSKFGRWYAQRTMADPTSPEGAETEEERRKRAMERMQ